MKADFSDVMARSGALLDRAEAALRRKLEDTPGDAAVVWNLAEVLRRRGALAEAADRYRQLAAAPREYPRAAFLAALLAGAPLEASQPAGSPQAAPFVRCGDFLTGDEQERVWRVAGTHAERFAESLLGDAVDPELRSSHVLYERELGEVAPWFLEKIVARLPELWDRLQVEAFDVGRREVQLTLHRDGEFFKVHKDSGRDGKTRTRRITYVYYFHRLPRRFRGGDLLLFDTDPMHDVGTSRYTRLAPVDNSVLFFPSHFYHQVTPVESPTDAVDDGRFTINGWLHGAEPGRG